MYVDLLSLVFYWLVKASSKPQEVVDGKVKIVYPFGCKFCCIVFSVLLIVCAIIMGTMGKYVTVAQMALIIIFSLGLLAVGIVLLLESVNRKGEASELGIGMYDVKGLFY